MIQSEKDVRKIVKSFFPKHIFSVEAARGGSDGYPDFTLVYKSRFQLIELKASKDFQDGRLYVEPRVSQLKFIRDTIKLETNIFYIAGLIGTDKIFIETGENVLKNGFLTTEVDKMGILVFIDRHTKYR